MTNSSSAMRAAMEWELERGLGDDLGDAVGEALEQGIADGVAVAFVDAIEAVYIEGEDGEVPTLLSLAASDHAREALQEQAAAGQAGEGIGAVATVPTVGAGLGGAGYECVAVTDFLILLLALKFGLVTLGGFPGQVGQGDEDGLLLGRQRSSGLGVEDTEGADVLPLRGDDGGAGVEADFGMVADDGILAKANVSFSVSDDHHSVVKDGVGAEGEVAWGLSDIGAEGALEPLAAAIEEGDEGEGCAEDGGGESGKAVEVWIGCGVKDSQVVEGLQPLVFGRRARGGGYSSLPRDFEIRWLCHK